MRFAFVAAATAVIAFSNASPAPASGASIALHAESLMDEHARLGAFSGCVLVADSHGPIFQKAYGLANREWDIPNALDTRFRVGSLSKQFTAALVMSLVDEARLDVDARLSAVLPWYRRDTGDQVTIRQLLNHTSGIDRSGVPRLIEKHGRTGMPLKDEVIEYCSGDLEWEPGTRFAYNNGGYLILGAVVEEIYGAPYSQVLNDVILAPLGMSDTGLDDSRRILARRADGYDRESVGLRKAEFVEATLAGPAGGLYSTVGDLYRWDRALYTDDVLSAGAREQMFTPGVGPYGFGWFILDMPVGPDLDARKAILHPGEGDGFHSILCRVPADSVAVILINNLGMTSLEEMIRGILDAVYGREPRVGIAEVMRNEIDTSGIEAAKEAYYRLQSEAGTKYDFAEEQLNTLGYNLMRRGSLSEARDVLALNAELFPESANAQDSLGEALEMAGDPVNAATHYRKALEIDPALEHAAKRLEGLQ